MIFSSDVKAPAGSVGTSHRGGGWSGAGERIIQSWAKAATDMRSYRSASVQYKGGVQYMTNARFLPSVSYREGSPQGCSGEPKQNQIAQYSQYGVRERRGKKANP